MADYSKFFKRDNFLASVKAAKKRKQKWEKEVQQKWAEKWSGFSFEGMSGFNFTDLTEILKGIIPTARVSN